MKPACNFGIKLLGGALLSAISGLAIAWLSGLFLKKLTGEPFEYLRYYYDYVNYVPESGAKADPVDEIVIIDTHDSAFGSREGFARLMDSLAVLSPKAVGIDQMFPLTDESTETVDSALQEAVARFPHPLVTACRHHGPDSLEHSFYTVPAGVDYGIVNAQSFYRFSPADSVLGQSVERLVVKLARKAGYAVADTPVVNYTNRSFRRLTTWDNVNAFTVNDKIVLIGDADDPKDEFDVPFRIDGQHTASGVVLNAYQLLSLIQPGTTFRAFSRWKTIALNAALILLYCALLVVLSNWKEKVSKNALISNACKSWKKTGIILLEPLFIFLAELIALLVMVGFIKSHHQVPNLSVFMAAVPFAGYSCLIAKEWADYFRDKKK